MYERVHRGWRLGFDLELAFEVDFMKLLLVLVLSKELPHHIYSYSISDFDAIESFEWVTPGYLTVCALFILEPHQMNQLLDVIHRPLNQMRFERPHL